ncbi:MAG: UvrD-helicase domain-containing protein [Desulfovibrionaceae bacterium]
MERFTADLHIHSRFSRATSKSLGPRLLAAWAMVKGIDVIGTGDFTHPEWLAELEEQLEPDGTGFFKLRNTSGLLKELPWLGAEPSGRVRFMLQAEISSIYKRGGRVRKVHNLIYAPDFDAVRRINAKLAQVGNLASDGRPILGLDSRHLLEMVLESHPRAFLIPAHIWTPWFSLFGSKSGFDSIEECYGELASEIFALETGLSSDPEMNWMWSKLDRFRLVSNSDAHSGEKLAREANLFQGEPSYDGVYHALRGESLGHKFLGTVEFFPEEGKYHLDGHRKCGVVMEPREAHEHRGICPVCGKPLTTGVLSRVLDLADRDEPVKPHNRPGFVSLVPLKEILSEVLGVGAGSKKVSDFYARLLRAFGSELDILQETPVEEIGKYSKPLAEGLGRMRRSEVIRTPGFDGQYGVISVFTDKERREIHSGGTLIQVREVAAPDPVKRADPEGELPLENAPTGPLEYNAAQKAALGAGPGPVLVKAGPGTGKTQTLMGRVNRLMEEGGNPRSILAVTFTRRAAAELRARLARLRGENEVLPRADTLHALAFEHWTESRGDPPVLMNEETSRRVFARVNPELSGARLKRAYNELMLARERHVPQDASLEGDAAAPPELAEALQRYERQKQTWDLADYTDLLVYWLEQIRAGNYANPYTQIMVDEVQDLTPLQLELCCSLAGKDGEGFFAIGDPNQSIYGFRGAVSDPEGVLRGRWPDLTVVELAENYRSHQAILDTAHGLTPQSAKLKAIQPSSAEIHFFQAPGPEREASWIAERIRRLIGATSHTLVDAGGEGELAPGDVAVLVRFRALIGPLEKALSRQGVPVSAPEEEAFWTEPRVATILRAAGRMVGLADDESEDVLALPEKILAQGPLGLAAYLSDIQPFDHLFWESRPFHRLCKAFDEHQTWTGLINWINLQNELELVSRRAEKVQILTLHAAKGLEFEAVFLPALEEGLLPFAGVDVLTGKVPEGGVGRSFNLEEERRLLYVGLTRARRLLYLSSSAKRRLFGKHLMLSPSRFIRELPQTDWTRSALVARKVISEKPVSLLD